MAGAQSGESPGPVSVCFPITASDSADIVNPNPTAYPFGDGPPTNFTRGIMITTTGILAVVFHDDLPGAASKLLPLTGGVFYPFNVRRVLATGTGGGIGAIFGFA